MATATTITSIKLDADIKERLNNVAAEQRRSAHWVIREAIDQYVDREEKRARFRKEAIAAWENYQTSGLHVTGEEADAWMLKLIAGKKVRPPKCHV